MLLVFSKPMERKLYFSVFVPVIKKEDHILPFFPLVRKKAIKEVSYYIQPWMDLQPLSLSLFLQLFQHLLYFFILRIYREGFLQMVLCLIFLS